MCSSDSNLQLGLLLALRKWLMPFNNQRAIQRLADSFFLESPRTPRIWFCFLYLFIHYIYIHEFGQYSRNPRWWTLFESLCSDYIHTAFVCFDYSMCAVFCSAVAKALVSRPTRPARLSNSTYVCWISKSKTVQILEVYWANWATVIQLHANLHKAFTQPFVEIEQHPDLHFQPGHSKAANVKAVKASPTELVFKRTPAAQACISCAQHEWTAL